LGRSFLAVHQVHEPVFGELGAGVEAAFVLPVKGHASVRHLDEAYTVRCPRTYFRRRAPRRSIGGGARVDRIGDDLGQDGLLGGARIGVTEILEQMQEIDAGLALRTDTKLISRGAAEML